MVLLWGSTTDGPFTQVSNELEKRQVEYSIIDQESVLDSDIELNLSGNISGRIKYQEKDLDSNQYHAAYLRPYDFRNISEHNFAADPELAAKAWRFETDLNLVLEHHPGKIINRVSRSVSNASKPYQAELIRKAGFQTPETIITSSPEFAIEFLKKHEKIIYKSISSFRSIVSCLTDKDIDRLKEITWCPVQFQKFIAGCDFRVHVLGEKIFTTKITSDESDYRYSKYTSLTDFNLGIELEEKCYRLTKELGLHFSGIDLRLDEDGQWYCFEVNPSPGYTYFSDATGQKITEELVDYLLVR